eukprot:comp21789_c0_seq1/m.30960 comp21789_c0_seq1/g.30960  ORF comp21789_c0_seq1/g.30960 comp21789_c0_seq1/m.30960 type:complete len:510 (-) comp21789_c0_seq1:83-1612(-)
MGPTSTLKATGTNKDLSTRVEKAVWEEIRPTLNAMNIHELRAKCLVNALDPSGPADALKQRIVQNIAAQSLKAVLQQDNMEAAGPEMAPTESDEGESSETSLSCPSAIDTSDREGERQIISTWKPAKLSAPAQSGHTASAWAGLPANILHRVMAYAGPTSGQVFSRVCKRWRLASHQCPGAWTGLLPHYFSWDNVRGIPMTVLRLATDLATADPEKMDHRYYLPEDVDVGDCTSYYEDSGSDYSASEWESTSDDSDFDPEDICQRARATRHRPDQDRTWQVWAARCRAIKKYRYGGVDFGPQTDVGLFVELCRICTEVRTVRLTGLLPGSLFRSIGSNFKHLDTLVCGFSQANPADFLFVAKGCPNLSTIIFEKSDWVREEVIGHIAGNCLQLRVLDMDACPWVEGRSIAVLAKGCPNLERIHLTGAWLEGGSLEALARHSHKLTCLELGSCYGVRDEGLAMLAADGACPALKHLFVGHADCTQQAVRNFKSRRPDCSIAMAEDDDDNW